MRKSNSIKLALKFYRNHSSGMRLENLIGFGGIFRYSRNPSYSRLSPITSRSLSWT